MGLFALLAVVAALAVWILLANNKKAETPDSEASPLDYDQAIQLDAEDLAEQGVRTAYEKLLPRLGKYVAHPWTIEEHIDADRGDYRVTAAGRDYVITGPDLDAERSWGLATVALFSIVNRQLEQSEHRLYALNGGNDLFGIFLTPSEAEAAQRALSNKSDWPYLPTDEQP